MVDVVRQANGARGHFQAMIPVKLVPTSDSKCPGNDVGPCNLVAGLTPRRGSTTQVHRRQPKTPRRVSHAGADVLRKRNLSSFGLVASHSGCGATLSWSTPDGSSARTL